MFSAQTKATRPTSRTLKVAAINRWLDEHSARLGERIKAGTIAEMKVWHEEAIQEHRVAKAAGDPSRWHLFSRVLNWDTAIKLRVELEELTKES